MQIRCPHCQNAIELVDDSDFQSIDCPSCGSQFGLVDVEQTEIDTLSKSRGTTATIGHFELIEEVGRGAFGTVWRARDSELDREVAIKIPRAHRLSAEDREQFLREARAVAQINHPNIVSVHEVGRDGEQLYIVSDFVKGVTLAEKLTAERLSQREAVELCVKIAAALEHAHENGVIHRDLKPSNIMLTADDDPQVMDFGLAKRDAGEITMTVEGKVLGTPAYMPPEQARGEGHHVDRRADVYSLGVILYELLSGELPFRGATRMLLHQVIHDEAPSPRKLNNAIPRDLETITLKCLQKDPGRRYQSAAELSADLECWLEGKPISARPVSWMERGWRWCKRKPAVAALSATVVLSITVGTLISGMLAVKASRRAVELNKTLAEKAELLEVTRLSAYNLQLTLVQNSWLSDPTNAMNLLKDEQFCTPELKDFSWRYFYRLSDRCRYEVNTQVNISDVAISPNGESVALCGFDSTVTIWDLQSGRRMAELEVDEKAGRLYSLSFSKDGSLLAAGSANSMVLLWDVEQKTQKAPLVAHTEDVYAVAFSQNGILASGSRDNTIKLWDTKNGTELLTLNGHSDDVRSIVFSSDGSTLFSASKDHTVRWWSVEGGQLGTISVGRPVNCVAIANTDDIIAYATDDSTITVASTKTDGQKTVLYGHEDQVVALRFLPKGKNLISASWDHTIRLWDIEERHEITVFHKHNKPVTGIDISVNGRVIASGGGDKKMISWKAREPIASIEWPNHTDGASGVVFSPDGKWLAASSGDAILPSGNGAMKIWNVALQRQMYQIESQGAATLSIAVTKDGRLLATGSADYSIKMSHVGENQPYDTLVGHTGKVFSVAFSPDGQWLASASGDNTVGIWRVETGKRISSLTGHSAPVTSVAFSPDGKWVATGGWDKLVKIWSTTNWDLRLTLAGHTNDVHAVDFAADSKTLATAGVDSIVKIWDARRGEILRNLRGHNGVVHAVAFSTDGKTLASAGDDKTIRLWDAATGQHRGTLRGHDNPVMSIAFSPNSNQLASGSNDGIVRIWNPDLIRHQALPKDANN